MGESFAAMFAYERLVARMDPHVFLKGKRRRNVSLYFLMSQIESLTQTLRWCLNLKAFPQSEHLNRLNTADSSWEIMCLWSR